MKTGWSWRPFWDVLVTVTFSVGVLAITVVPVPRAVRWFFVLPFLTFFLGYSFVAVAFPSARANVGEGETSDRASTQGNLAGLGQRLLLSMGLSFAFTLLMVYVVSLVHRPDANATLVSTSGVALLASAGAFFRRRKLPINELDRFSQGLRAGVKFLKSPTHVAVMLGCGLALGGLWAFAALEFQGSPQLTEFQLLDQQGGFFSDEDRVAPGSNQSVLIVVRNLEGERREYFLVVVCNCSGQRAAIGPVVPVSLETSAETSIPLRFLVPADATHVSFELRVGDQTSENYRSTTIRYASAPSPAAT